MKTVAIISEYNPFHTGHEYQIRKIREEFGYDTRIVAIMSGNYTQRGDVAIADKSLRAECAVRCGINLVLELPFPFSISSAELFAKSGVHIANELGVIDYLSFGSELGDLDSLTKIADNMSSDNFKTSLNGVISANENKNYGYPTLCEIAYKKEYGEDINSSLFLPNNILALEYLKALKLFGSDITPHTLKRLGADYSEQIIVDAKHQSASAIRDLLFKDVISALNYIPQNTKKVLLDAYNNGAFPCNADKLSPAIISHFRLNPSPINSEIQDIGGGLYNRLRNASFDAATISELTALTDTKKYTTARIRRAIWYSFFGVTSSTVKELPYYTQLLAADCIGRSIIKEIKKTTGFPIITKPSSYSFLSEKAKKQKELADSADTVFQLTKPKSSHGHTALKTSPYISK